MLLLTRLCALALAGMIGGCADIAADYRGAAEAMRLGGLLRTEKAPADAPFSNADLILNFRRIALHREFRREGGLLIEDPTPTPLSRWESPVRYAVLGAAATDADRRALRQYAARLAALTGLDIAEAGPEQDANLTMLFLGAEERGLFLDQLRDGGMTAAMPLAARWARDPDYPCVAQVGFADAGSGRIVRGMILIKGELEGVLRHACIQEETAQSLGLFNDDDRARPSIFNDDQEFAQLTAHDEMLLRILYHPRMRAGMPPAEAGAAAAEVVAALRPGA